MEHQNSTLNTSTTSANLPSYACDCGFGVGTLVWTDKGQVPIEQLKVGDMVLSQDEATGERAYKSIARTFVHHNQPICRLHYQTADDDQRQVYITANHPIWVFDERKNKGSWVEAGAMDQFDELVLSSGVSTFAIGWSEAYRWTQKPIEGWSKDFWLFDTWNNKSFTPLMAEGYHLDDDRQIPLIDGYLEGDSAEQIPYTTDVHNIEVADFHTYFVDDLGLWVRDKDRGVNSSR